MKKLTVLFLIIFFLQITGFSQLNINDCTIGVASGSATQDGRPLAWKTRDFDSYIDMQLKYNTFWEYKYIMISPLSYYSTTGLNEHGLVIFMSNTYDLEPAPSGPEEQDVLKYALGYCRTIAEFQEYLDSTNVTGRRVVGNFALLDSTGAAVIFEVAGYEYWRFDAEDEPNGYIIRTCFTVNGGGTTGLSRYERSSELINDFYAGDSLNYRSLLRFHMRDFSDYASQPYPVPFLDQVNPSIPYGYFPANYSICRDISTSSAVIHGVLPSEKAKLSTLWAILGQPAAGIAVPYWPVGETPQVSNSTPTAPLCDIALEIKDLLFDLSGFPTCINSHLLRDTTGGGLWTCSFPNENIILDSAEIMLDQWRVLDSVPVNAMLNLENDLAEMAYDDLLECHSLLISTGLESHTRLNEFNIYPNPVHDFLNTSLSSRERPYNILIYNQVGQMVKECRMVESRINISELPVGIYILELKTENYKTRKKFIKYTNNN